MSSDFDPSPRASKRRRTTRYGAQRTILADDATEKGASNVQSVSDPDKTDVPSENATSPKDQIEDANVHSSAKKSRTSSRTSAAKTRAQAAPNSRRKPIPQDLESLGDTETSDTPETPSRSAQKPKTASSRKAGSDSERANTGVNVNGENGTDEQVGEDGSEKEEEPIPQPRSSGRQRRPPRRLADTLADSPKPTPTKRTKISAVQPDLVGSAPASPALKGILTPSKKQRTGVRKSVMFNHDEKEIEEQLGFRDIDTPARPKAKTTTRKATPYPKKSQPIEEIEEEPTDTSRDTQLQPDVDDDVFDDMLIDEPTVDIPLHDPSTDNVPAMTVNLPADNLQLQEFKSRVLARLTSTSLPSKTPTHLEKQYSQLHSLLRSTITASESNSLLLLGPRGAGKSLLLDLALRDLDKAYPNDFHTVHLNGFLQTDDRLALREIWRQLGHSRELDDSETEDIGASYADTMASLLSLLSHPDEMAVDPVSTGDIETLAQDSSTVASGGHKISKSIVFILDEFDLFTTHPRQTLLYNLFDIAQSRKAPIAVIGCSTRMDVIECLEKRVKSRFSHRWLLVPSVKTTAEWNQCVEDALLIDTSEEATARMSKEEEKWALKWNAEMKTTLLPTPQIQTLIKTHFYTTKSLPDLFIALYPTIAALQIPSTNQTHIPQPTNAPTILTTLLHLPTLHLTLLIAMSRLETIHHLTTSNFNLVHAHYTELIASTRLRQSAHGSIAASGSLRQWSRELCRGAWEELGEWGVIVPVSGGRDDEGGQEEETRMWRCEVGLEDVEWGVRGRFVVEPGEKVGGAGEILLRWCREV